MCVNVTIYCTIGHEKITSQSNKNYSYVKKHQFKIYHGFVKLITDQKKYNFHIFGTKTSSAFAVKTVFLGRNSADN